jgi:intein/homing endonuclease
MRDLGLTGHRSWEKFVPDVYKFASIENRLDLLHGYLDGDGSIKPDGNIRVSTASERQEADIQQIIRSLGGDCKVVHISDKTYIYKGAVTECRDEYRSTASSSR